MGFDGLAETADVELGTRRARAAALLTLALPGSAYIYQGEELGLPEVEDLPVEVLQDPTWERSGHTARGRDGCRVPLPWAGDTPPFGFSTAENSAAPAAPWLPQPQGWSALSVEAQQRDPNSMLSLYRSALRLRREQNGWLAGDFDWLDSPADVLAFERGGGLRCVVNLSSIPFSLAGLGRVILSSEPDVGPELPTDAAVWLASSTPDKVR